MEAGLKKSTIIGTGTRKVAEATFKAAMDTGYCRLPGHVGRGGRLTLTRQRDLHGGSEGWVLHSTSHIKVEVEGGGRFH